MVDVRERVTARWPLRLPPGGVDGVLRRRGAVRERLLHVEGRPVVVAVALADARTLAFAARAGDEHDARAGIARMRFALGADDDLRPFYERFRDDPLIGGSVRRRPDLRILRRPDPFEALAWAICEQLIEAQRAFAIQRRIVRGLGRTWPQRGLYAPPAPVALAAVAPARLQAMDLSAGRARLLVRVAGEVAAGRIALDPDDPRAADGHRRLRAIPGIGSWTVESLALYGQGRLDVLPAGDLAYLRLVGRLQTGDPRARVTEDEVRAFFAPYAPWAGLAAAHALRSAGSSAALTAPGRAGTRSSAPPTSAVA